MQLIKGNRKMKKEMIERCIVAARAKRAELINKPLDRCYEEIVIAIIKELSTITDAEANSLKEVDDDHMIHTNCYTCGGHAEGMQNILKAILNEH